MEISGEMGLIASPKVCLVIGAYDILKERSSLYESGGTVNANPSSGSPDLSTVMISPSGVTLVLLTDTVFPVVISPVFPCVPIDSEEDSSVSAVLKKQPDRDEDSRTRAKRIAENLCNLDISFTALRHDCRQESPGGSESDDASILLSN
jgi:hypothetical protein